VLGGFHTCQGLAVADNGDRVAVACSGRFDGDSISTLEESGVVVLGTGAGLEPIAQFSAAEVAGQPLGFGVAWAGAQTLLVTSFGSFDGAGDSAESDRVFELALDSASSREVIASKDEPFVLGDVSCAAECGACLVTDAERGVVHRLVVSGGTVQTSEALTVDRVIGLPPRSLGRF
jgi:hypothetical protein